MLTGVVGEEKHRSHRTLCERERKKAAREIGQGVEAAEERSCISRVV